MTRVASIEEALEKTSFGRFNYALILLTGLILHNVTLESVGISFALPILECDLQLSYEQQGILGAVSFIGIIVSSHFWGFLADTRGRKRIMQPALLLEFLVTILSSFSTSFLMLAVMRLLNGVLLSAGSATVFAYLGEFHGATYRNRAIFYASCISAIMAITFPLIAWVFINQSWSLAIPYIGITYKPWRLYILFCGIYAMICGIAFNFLPESPKYLLRAGRGDDALEILKGVHKRNTKDEQFDITGLLPETSTPIGATKSNCVTSTVQLMWRQTAPLFGRQHLRKTVLASLIQFIIYFNAQGVYMWFPYILDKLMQFTQNDYTERFSRRLCDILKFTQLNLVEVEEVDQKPCKSHLEISTYQLTIVLELIYVSLLVLICYALRRFGRISILFSTLLVTGLCGVLSIMVELPLVAIYLFIVFLCCGLGTTVVNAIVVDIFPTNFRAMAMCISLMMGRIGSVCGSNVMGAFIDTECDWTLLCASCSLLLACVLAWLLPTEQSKAVLT